MSPYRFSIAPALLGGISNLVPGEKSLLSPLRIANAAELTPEQISQLEASGMLQNGQLRDEARVLLTTLSEAQAFTRLRVNAPSGFLDEAVYFGPDPTQTAQISNTAEGLSLATPSDSEGILARISEFTGSSALPAPAWSEELPPLEGLVLASLMDLRRKAVIRALIENQAVTPPPSDTQSIAAAIQGLLGNAQWFAAAVLNVCGLNGAPPPVQVQAALDSLDGKHRVWRQDASYFPLPEAIQAADRFLMTSVLVSLDLGHANTQGKANFNRVAWLQSGVSETFHIYPSVNQVRMETHSPAAALDKIRFYLTQIEALPAPPLEVVQLAVAIQTGVGAGQAFTLGDETVLGRSEGAHIRILDARASRRHSVIQKVGEGYQVSDAGSTNGTYLNGQLLTGPVWLKEGDVISIGDTRIAVIRAGAPAPVVESQRTIYANEAHRPLPPEPAAPPYPEVEAEPEPEPVLAEPPEAPVEAPVASGLAESPEPLPPEPVPAEPLAADPAGEPEPLDQPVEAPVEALPPEPAEIVEPGPEPEPTPGPPPVEPAAPEPPLEPLAQEPRPDRCPRCGSETSPSARFCGTCGLRLIP